MIRDTFISCSWWFFFLVPWMLVDITWVNISLSLSLYIYIYIYIKAIFIKDAKTLFIFFNCSFSSLLVILLMSGSRLYRNGRISSAQALSTILFLSSGSRHKKNYKKTWKITIKSNKQCSIIFNKTCLNYNLLPKYTLFNIYIYIYVCVCVCVCSRACVCAYIEHFSTSLKESNAQNRQYIIFSSVDLEK